MNTVGTLKPLTKSNQDSLRKNGIPGVLASGLACLLRCQQRICRILSPRQPPRPANELNQHPTAAYHDHAGHGLPDIPMGLLAFLKSAKELHTKQLKAMHSEFSQVESALSGGVKSWMELMLDLDNSSAPSRAEFSLALDFNAFDSSPDQLRRSPKTEMAEFNLFNSF